MDNTNIPFKYRTADLDYIFVRIGAKNFSLNQMTDSQFVEWAEAKFGVKIRDDENALGTAWTPEQKVDFLNDMSDKIGQPAVVMIREEARHEFNKGE